MSGAQFGTGLNASVVGGLYSGATAPPTPSPHAYPEGNTTVTQAAYGVDSSDGVTSAGLHCAWAGALAFGLLVFMWWSLPR